MIFRTTRPKLAKLDGKGPRSAFRWGSCALALLAGGLQTGLKAGDNRETLKVGYFADAFVQDAPEGENRTQFEPWIRELVRKSDAGTVDAKLETYSDFESKLIESKGAAWDLCAMYAYDFIRLRQYCNLDPLLVPTWDGTTQTEYAIYVPQTSRITKMEHLNQKRILFEVDGRGELPYFWFDNLMRKTTGQSYKKITTSKSVASAISAALPVFFDEDGYEACVLSNTGFQQIMAGNPQVGKFIKPLATAPKLMTHIIACRRDLAADVRQNIVNISLALSDAGRGRLSPLHFSVFKPEQLENLEHVWLEYQTNLMNESNQPANAEPALENRPKTLLEARAAAASTGAKPGAANTANRDTFANPFRFPTGKGAQAPAASAPR